MDTITHVTRRGSSEFTLTNTNKLIKQYEWATGLKTGSTSLAGFCLSASANKNGVQLISVVMASPSGKTRVSDSIALLNYGYGICSLYKDDDMPELAPVQVIRGTSETVPCRYTSEFTHLFLDNYDMSLIEKTTEYLENITAPINEGDPVGQLTYRYNGEIIGTVDIVATQGVDRSTFVDHLKMLWLQYLT